MSFEILAAASAENPLAEIGNIFTEDFGWKPTLFFAQCINFIFIVFVLKKFAFGPLGTMLAERRERIKAGEEKLKQIEIDLAETEKRTAAALEEANAKAKAMISEAQDSAAKLGEEKTQEAIASAQRILTKAEEAAKADREQMVAELKADFGKLVATATATVAGKVLTDADHATINAEALNVIEK